VIEFEQINVIEIGHAEIDEQHRRLILLAMDAIDSAINSADHKPDAVELQALTDAVVEHFAFEEGLMRATGYPEAERHAKYHAALMMEFRAHFSKARSEQDTDPGNLITYFWNWLSVHSISADRELVEWLKTNASGGVK
jgi:hemerythrin-like metal-binding protein